MHNQPNPTARRISARQACWLLAAVAATAVNLALYAVDYEHTIVTGMLVGAAAVGVMCWRQELTEERLQAQMATAATDMWWHGYATCLEDTNAGQPERRVVPFRLPRGDRNGDSGRLVNGSEVP